MSTNIRGDRTRAHVLETAWELISKQGADVSVSELASAAGISRQTLYQHFGSRGGLLLELVRRADAKFEIKEKFAAALKIESPEDRLSLTLRAWLDFVPLVYPVAKDLIRLKDKDTEAAAAWEDRMSELRAWLLELMTTLESDRALSPDWTPKAASEFFWAQASVQNWGLLTEDCNWDRAEVEHRLNSVLVNSLLRTRRGA